MDDPRTAIIEDLYESYRTRDPERILPFFNPDVQIFQTRQLPWGGLYSGFTEAGSFMSKLTSNVNSDVSIDEIVSAGECRLVLGRTRGRALTTNKDFDVQIVHIYTFDEENKITKVDFYIDTPAMLEAL